MSNLSKEWMQLESMFRSLKEKNKDKPQSIQDIRTSLDMLAAAIPVPPDVRKERIDANGVPCKFIFVKDYKIKDKAIFHIHGGAYIGGSVDNSREFLGRISRDTGVRCLSVDYRLAPENQFPSWLDDSVTAYKWLIKEGGIEPKNIIIMGESAGGGLALATMLKIREENKDLLPKAAVLVSPWTDLTSEKESLKTKAEADLFLSAEGYDAMVSLILRGHNIKDPYVSPLFGDLKGLPPTLMMVGTSEILLDDSLHLAEKLEKSGVSAKINVHENLLHCFPLFNPKIPEVKAGSDEIIDFIRSNLELKYAEREAKRPIGVEHV